MAIPTDFSVTTANVKPIANPKPPIDGPQAKDAQPAPATPAPEAKDAQPEAVTPAPQVLTANPADPSVPPFPLNHARILYANTLPANQGIVAPSGQPTADLALIPNTYQRWKFTDGSTYTVTLTSARLVDTVCIGAHNLGTLKYDLKIEYSTTETGDNFVDFVPELFPQDDKAIMAHIDTPVSLFRLRLTLSGTGVGDIGYISAGRALQMQRPFFGGSTPMNENRVVRYYDAWTESGNLVARSRRAVSLENSFSWNNIQDAWYREYYQPFRDSAEELPFFIAWNLLEYPNDVAFALAQNFDTSYSGTRSLRTVSFDARGVA